MEVKKRIEKLLDELNKGIYEKEEVMDLSLLSAIAGESIFMLGAPGVAKSLIARRLKYAFKDGKSFEYLMSRFSTPDEIFGPVKISELKDHDKYERAIEKYLPGADVVFLDEIWKAGSSIQNALLTVINEKVYRNGEEEIEVPMKVLISASNGPPPKNEDNKDNEGLEALWDRFLLRLVVEGIQKPENFNKMISKKLDPYKDTVSEDLKITGEDFVEWSEAIDEIKIPKHIFNVIDVIRKKLQLHNDKEDNKDNQIYISDRRWRKIIRLLRTSAFLNDRTEVDLMDCFLIKHCIWNREEQINTAWQFVSGTIEKHGYEYKLPVPLSDIDKDLKDIDADVKNWTEGEKPVEHKKELPDEQNTCYYKIKNLDYGYIKKGEYDTISNKGYTSCVSHDPSYTQYKPYGKKEKNIWLKPSTNENKVFVSEDENPDEDIEYNFETETRNEKFPYIKPAHSGAKEKWDKRIKVVLNKTGNCKSQIETHKSNSLKDIYCNLFVDKSFAVHVENNLNNLLEQIEQLEFEAGRIQNAYTTIDSPSDSGETLFIDHEESI